MSVETPLSRVASLLDYLITAEMVPNTFGTIWQMRDALEQIDVGLPDNAAGNLPPDNLQQLRQVLTTIEENRALFAIPEKHLIEAVYRATARLRKKVGS